MKKNHALRKLVPIPFTDVRLTDIFYAPRQMINRRVTLPMEYRQMKKTGHLDAWTWKKGRSKPPHIFWDSDVAKWMEAASYSLATHLDAKLEKQLDEIINKMAAAQAKDGYLNTHFLFVEPEKRWTNLRDWHELYCAGHLIEAAVAHYTSTGKKTFLDIMIHYADYIATVFGTGKGQKRGYCGHEEIELALVKLYRATNERRFLDLALYFINERGRRPLYFVSEARERGEKKILQNFDLEEWQVHKPVREQTEAVGHAVRAGYLYCAMADLAAETGDATLLKACRKIWRNIVERRMYVIGGIGSTRFDERFTFDYDLPNEEAYAETCAAISLVFFAHRMLQTDPDRQYADVIERALYNGVMSGASLDGRRFFYDNRLAVKPESLKFNHQRPATRQEWFGCACCPPNVSRLLASISGYAYSLSKDTLWMHLYMDGTLTTNIAGESMSIRQNTRYPWDGKIKINLGIKQSAQFTLALRIPGWCRQASLQVNGKPVVLAPVMRKGYALINRLWCDRDQLELNLPMPVERIESHPSVRQNAGRIALQRGPVVYCLEEVDNGKDLNDIVFGAQSVFCASFRSGLLGGVTVISGKAWRRNTTVWQNELYRAQSTGFKPVTIKAIPYACWGNRKPGEMLVWIRSGNQL